MLELRTLPVEAVDRCIENGEFDNDVTAAAEHVAIVMTQGWCPQWIAMKHYLERIAREGAVASGADQADESKTVVVYTLVYDQIEAFGRFRNLKETVFENDLIPYIRYYKDGRLTDTSNFVGRKEFLQRATK